MLTLVVLTAAFLAVTLVAAIVVILIFVLQIRAFMAETSAALDVVNVAAGRLAGRVERIQAATHAAANSLAPAES
ncbi:MAG: hypothetical protein KY454_02370 [Actinobacteria bacterium]|nr:hypothetical protein [Actinomycetota bacterium]